LRVEMSNLKSWETRRGMTCEWWSSSPEQGALRGMSDFGSQQCIARCPTRRRV
jgi:hypothetical protein